MLAIIPTVGLIALFFVGALAIIVVWIVWEQIHPNKMEQWPMAEGTIQSVNTEITYQGRGSTAHPVGDFSYRVGIEYYSGRLRVSCTDDGGDRSPKTLVGRKISVRYNPQRPEEFFVPPTDVDGFSIGQKYNLPFQSDAEPTILNIDK